MNTKKHFLTICGTILLLSLLLLSCSTSKKTALSCPEFSINNKNRMAVNHKRIMNKILTAQNRVKTRKQSGNLSRKNKEVDITVLKNSPPKNNVIEPGIESVSNLNKTEYSKNLIASTDNSIIPLRLNTTSTPSLEKTDFFGQTKDLISPQPVKCDTIVLKSGSLLVGKVEEIGQTEIKYRKCNNLSGPLNIISKSDVSVIFYSNGTREIITSVNSTAVSNNDITINDNNTTKQFEPFGIAGFGSGLLAFLIAGLILGSVAMVFGGISLARISKNPKKYKGRGFAIASIILGIIDVVLMIVALSAM